MLTYLIIGIHEFQVTSGPRQQGVGNKIHLKTDDRRESNFSPGRDNTLYLSPCKNKSAFDLDLGRHRGSKFKNPPFYLHFWLIRHL